MAIDKALLESLDELSRDDLREVLRDVARDQHELMEAVTQALAGAKVDGTLSKKMEGTPRDTAVQKAASILLRQWYVVDALTLQEVGDRLGISKNRARELLRKLLPLEYDSVAASRRGQAHPGRASASDDDDRERVS